MSSAAIALAPAIVDRVRQQVARDGVAVTAKSLGVDRSVVTRVCAALPVRRGTVALLTQTLAADMAPTGDRI